jgi:hypothetical protein
MSFQERRQHRKGITDEHQANKRVDYDKDLQLNRLRKEQFMEDLTKTLTGHEQYLIIKRELYHPEIVEAVGAAWAQFFTPNRRTVRGVIEYDKWHKPKKYGPIPNTSLRQPSIHLPELKVRYDEKTKHILTQSARIIEDYSQENIEKLVGMTLSSGGRHEFSDCGEGFELKIAYRQTSNGNDRAIRYWLRNDNEKGQFRRSIPIHAVFEDRNSLLDYLADGLNSHNQAPKIFWAEYEHESMTI